CWYPITYGWSIHHDAPAGKGDVSAASTTLSKFEQQDTSYSTAPRSKPCIWQMRPHGSLPVDFSARTVITGDPNLELDEVGVPKSIAMNLTYPKHVMPYNIAYLQELVRDRPTAHPLDRISGCTIRCLGHERADRPLVQQARRRRLPAVRLDRRTTPEGWRPSLHKMSMMSHRVKLMPYSTFRLNLSVTPPYNADFDGDEMNMHIGIGDTIADRNTMEHIKEQISIRKQSVVQAIEDATHDRLKAAPGMTVRESFESRVERELNLARDQNGQYAQKALKEDNNVKQMVTAGSKGSFINISQMSVCVGQQIVEGHRIPFGFRHRTLPHFTKDDFSPEARGIVENSYLRGLTPQEFFFHAMAGREGLIDTAVKTAETGYIQRRLVKALEDVAVCYDGTVRNSLGDLVQFVYGEDGMDGAFIERQNIETFVLNDREFAHNYRVDVTDPSGGFLPGVLQAGLDDSSLELQGKLDEEYDQLVQDCRLLCEFVFRSQDPSVPHHLPVNLQRIVQNAIQIFHIDRRKPSDLDPAYIIDTVRELAERLVVVRGDGRISQEAQNNATPLFRTHLRATFAARRVLERFHGSIGVGSWRSRGKVQSIRGAPRRDVGTSRSGVPRLKEIINVATNIKTPSLSVFLAPHIAKDKILANRVQKELAYTSLRTVTAAVEIWYDPDPTSTIIKEDGVFIESFFAIPDEEVEQKLHLQSPWLLHLELDRAKMIDRKLTMSYVAGRIAESFKTDLFVIWSEDNSEKLIIRCRVLGGADKDEDGMETVEEDIFLRQLENTMLNSISLRGVPGINRVFLLEHDKVVITDEGSIKAHQEKEWVLETDGVNLKTVMTVDGVDFRRTYSNSCVEIFNVLGFEAARVAIMKELRGVIEFDGSYINYRHLSLLCDLMTHRGTLMAITRHGINQSALLRGALVHAAHVREHRAFGESSDSHVPWKFVGLRNSCKLCLSRCQCGRSWEMVCLQIVRPRWFVFWTWTTVENTFRILEVLHLLK
ncbi:uncharacterized protein B0H18DRAFT_1193799, partial [Fomitopsis serialis]|uniref:uncharacterized protein n=1 Tax=Fomitopsis serialis TaxID=139415 RepID=UPI002007C268